MAEIVTTPAMMKTERKAVSAAAATAAAAQVRGAVQGGASLCDALDRLLTTGVVVVADATLKVADIDLVRLQFQLVLSSAAGPTEFP